MATDKEQVQEFLSIAKESVDKYVAGLDFAALSAAKQLILDAEAKGNRLHVTGIGKPGHVSGYAASLFSSTGTPTYELHGTETGELKSTVTCLKGVGVHIIALTGNPDSWLANEAEVALIAGVDQEGDSMNKPPRASILAEIIELQCLSILLQNEFGLDPKQYVKWHPGGALGASIREGK